MGGDALSDFYMNLESAVLVKNLIQGATYRAQYRAVNQIGAGPWSDSAYLLVGSAPQAPQTPILISADETKITLLVALSLNDYGAPIESYKLYVNKGVNGSPFLEITDYDGSSPTYDLMVDQMIGTFKVFKGGLYRFKTTASNSIGASGFSNELTVALAGLPETPSAPTFD